MCEAQLADSCLEQRSRYCRAEAALGTMVLGDDDPPAGRIRGGDQRVGVDRLDRIRVDHARVDPVPRELIGRAEAFVHCDAGADERYRVGWIDRRTFEPPAWNCSPTSYRTG